MKRTILIGSLLLASAAIDAGAQDASGPTVVIVHGAWGGGWDWKGMEQLLRDRGRIVYRPTLTGLGERHHLASADVGLDTHITDVANLIEWERLTDVVLVGHSYGGMVITGVAERVPDRIRRLVYLDAFVPFDGECVNSVRSGNAGACGEIEPSAPALLVPNWVQQGTPAPRDVPHPAKTFVDRISLEAQPGHGRPATYILTVEQPGREDSFDWAARRAKELGWTVHELVADHNPQRSKPAELLELLLNAR